MPPTTPACGHERTDERRGSPFRDSRGGRASRSGCSSAGADVDAAGRRRHQALRTVTVLSDGVVRKLRVEVEVDVNAVISQFGWQFVKRFDGTGSSLTPVTEWVVLLGGLEQGVVLPSLSWLVGIRTHEGVELGVGPNLTPVGAALAVAAGMTFRSGALNFPLNVAVVPSKAGVRVSLLSGFNMRR
jgi:hypothetical protein